MRAPEQITANLRDRFEREWPEWARGGGTWPMRIGLQPPSTQQRSADPVACHAFAAQWRRYTGPGTVEYAAARFPTGLHQMPKTLILAAREDVAGVDARCERTWRTAGRRLTQLQQAFPAARFDRVVRRVVELAEVDYQALVETVAWLCRNPTSGLLLRQLPVEGIGTKWLEQHAALVLAMLGNDGEDQPAASGAEEPPGSARTRLHARLGLRVPPDLVQIAVLDPQLRAQVGGMRHFAASTEDLNRWERVPRAVVILENKETGYAFTEDLDGVVVLHGQGFNVLNYARIDWIRAAQKVVYWGDIDGPGLEFVGDLRRNGVAAASVLMDTETLTAFRHLSVAGAAPRRASAANMTGSETELYEHLREHAAHGAGVLLEQERIPWDLAHRSVLAALTLESEN